MHEWQENDGKFYDDYKTVRTYWLILALEINMKYSLYSTRRSATFVILIYTSVLII